MLLLGNLVIGSGVMLPAGLLNPIAAELAVSSAAAGQLMLAGGIVVAIGAPLLAAFTSAIDRRKLLVFSLLLFGAGHLASAVVTDFTSLLVLRAVTMMGATIFTPQAAATAGLLVPGARRAEAIAFIFIGWSAASVVGIPLASYLANVVGWRSVFVGMGLLCLVAAALVWISLESRLFVTPLNAAAWRQALTSPLILTILLVTAFSMSGQMMVFTYLAPLFRDVFAAGPGAISAGFAVAGVTGVIGNFIAARVVGRFGIDPVIAAMVSCLVAGLGIFAAGFGSLPVAMLGIGIWGFGSFSSNSLQQSRLVAVAPALASATVALNTSVVYVGQASGAALGGWFMTQASGAAPTSAIAWAGAGFTLLALLASFCATRLKNTS
jgi:MFS transporter, DHA1 family, inner membrane transport protein